MTLPVSGIISLGDVLNELRTVNPGRNFPISLGDADVRELGGVPNSGVISLSNFYGKSAAAPLSATGNNDYGYGSSATSPGTVTCAPSVTVQGGSGARAFAWSILSSNGTVTLANETQQQCRVSRGYTRYSTGSVTVYLRCVISDSTGSVTVDNITAQLVWDSGV